jgi:hypothetical protein
MVQRRTARLILRSHEMLAQLARMRQEAKQQDRDGWLKRAKAQAARVASQTPRTVPTIASRPVRKRDARIQSRSRGCCVVHMRRVRPAEYSGLRCRSR